MATRIVPTNVEISCNWVFNFFCVDYGKSSEHIFFTNYDFLIDMHTNHIYFIFIPVSFHSALYRDFIPEYYSGAGHAGFVLIDATCDIVLYFDPNCDDEQDIYDHTISYVTTQVSNYKKIWTRNGRTLKLKNVTMNTFTCSHTRHLVGAIVLLWWPLMFVFCNHHHHMRYQILLG